MDTKTAIEKLENEYPNGLDLVYIDYNDELCDAWGMENILKRWYFEDEPDRIWDCQSYWVDCVFDEHFKDEELDDETKEAIRDRCYEHDTSTPEKDIIKNTRKKLMIYDLWYDDDWDSFDLDERVQGIIDFLWIPADDKNFEWCQNAIRKLCLDAYGWWSLEIIFDWDLIDFYWDKTEKYMQFDATLGIINRWEWSGNFEEMPFVITVPFDRKRLYIDEAHRYWVGEIFGMNNIDDWWYSFNDDVSWFCPIKDKIPDEEETVKDKERKQEEYFQAEYRKWICHIEDAKFSRHTTVYVNEYPCGSRCTKCWRFFID